jgi:hypothetical protein
MPWSVCATGRPQYHLIRLESDSYPDSSLVHTSICSRKRFALYSTLYCKVDSSVRFDTDECLRANGLSLQRSDRRISRRLEWLVSASKLLNDVEGQLEQVAMVRLLDKMDEYCRYPRRSSGESHASSRWLVVSCSSCLRRGEHVELLEQLEGAVSDQRKRL